MKKQSKFAKNIVYGFCSQFIILVLGIVVPRILIKGYGSDINGLLSTITQIYTYMALLEAGIGQAARNVLYKPLSEGDEKQVSHYASVARNYYRRISVYYGIGVIILSVICPFIIKTDVSRITVFFVILLEGLSGAISFYFIQTTTCILRADGKEYVNKSLNVINKILGYAAKIIMASNGINIILLQLVFCVITIGKVIFYRVYFRKHYDWVNFTVVSKTEKLKDRNYFIITEIAWTIFSSTDMIILSTLVSTKASSVYYVYNIVFTSLNHLIYAVFMSVTYRLGQTYHKSIKEYCRLHDAYNSVFYGAITIAVSVAYMLIIPFVKLYTHSVTDINYIYTELPLLFSLVQLLSWARYITGQLSGIAGYAKETSYVSIVEALINISCSIILVNKFGIVGVLFATVIALPIKVIYLEFIADHKVLKRSPVNYLKIIGANAFIFAVVVFVNSRIELRIISYIDFIKYAVLISSIVTVTSIALNCLANPSCIKIAKKLLRKV